jgi:hypothetical protein
MSGVDGASLFDFKLVFSIIVETLSVKRVDYISFPNSVIGLSL